MNLATRISQMAEANEVEFVTRGSDRADLDALADVLEIELNYQGNDDNAADQLAAAIDELP